MRIRLLVANHAVQSSTDNSGPGVARSVAINISALKTFSSGSLLMIDANTSATLGPTPTSVTPASQMTVSLGGYGVAFLTLKTVSWRGSFEWNKF